MRWAVHLFSLEMRKTFSYRVDFWTNFLGGVLTELVVAYFLWDAIYQVRGVPEIGGFSFRAMLLYYVLVALCRRSVMALDQGAISYEIYDGSLNRYLVYPVSLFSYKYISWLANAIVVWLQLLISFGLFLRIFGAPVDRHLSFQALLIGSISLWGASSVYYLFSMLFEMVSFWAESVWSLLVMLRFIAQLLGGGMIPIALFPHWSRAYLRYLPFEHMFSVPVRAFMGEVSFSELGASFAVLAAWAVVLWMALGWVWRKGTLQYSGVGI